jgi:murein DD-endopeptidase MepM/ murein hydrolase activator NlpD
MRFPFDKPHPRISSPYGWRIHPIEKTRKHHNGVDYAMAVGTPLYAIAKGRVLFAGPSTLKFANGEPRGGGYIVKIRHKVNGEWITSSYMHLKKGSIKAAGIKKGDLVVEGQKIGESGNTGESTGPHLHFEIQRGKTYIWTNNGTRYTEPVSFIKTQIAVEKAKKAKK